MGQVKVDDKSNEITAHLILEELEGRYRQATEAIARSNYRIIGLLAQGRGTEEVAAITSYSRSWLYELVWGYNRLGHCWRIHEPRFLR